MGNYKNLHEAVSARDFTVIKEMIENGSEVDERNQLGETVLFSLLKLFPPQKHSYEYKNSSEIMFFLINKGADLNVKNNKSELLTASLPRKHKMQELNTNILNAYLSQVAPDYEIIIYFLENWLINPNKLDLRKLSLEYAERLLAWTESESKVAFIRCRLFSFLENYINQQKEYPYLLEALEKLLAENNRTLVIRAMLNGHPINAVIEDIAEKINFDNVTTQMMQQLADEYETTRQRLDDLKATIADLSEEEAKQIDIIYENLNNLVYSKSYKNDLHSVSQYSRDIVQNSQYQDSVVEQYEEFENANKLKRKPVFEQLAKHSYAIQHGQFFGKDGVLNQEKGTRLQEARRELLAEAAETRKDSVDQGALGEFQV